MTKKFGVPPEAGVVEVRPDGLDVPKLIGVQDDPRDGAHQEDEDDGEEHQLFHGTTETQVLVVRPLASARCPPLALDQQDGLLTLFDPPNYDHGNL